MPSHTVSMLIFADIFRSVYIKKVMSSSGRGKGKARLIGCVIIESSLRSCNISRIEGSSAEIRCVCACAFVNERER